MIGNHVKRFIAAVLGLALTIPLAPAAQAQSLNFGSLGGGETDVSPELEHWTKGVEYSVGAAIAWDSRSDEFCNLHMSLNLMSAYEIPKGRLAWLDHATGFEFEDDTWSPTRISALLLPYPNSYRYVDPDFTGTTREMTFYIIENGTNNRIRLGTLNLTFPTKCPISGATQGSSAVLEEGTIRP